MTFDFDTLNIFIYAFFALAAVAAVLAATGVRMAMRRPATAAAPSLTLVRGAVREHPALAGRAPLPHERAA
jgi:hypothetical protein